MNMDVIQSKIHVHHPYHSKYQLPYDINSSTFYYLIHFRRGNRKWNQVPSMNNVNEINLFEMSCSAIKYFIPIGCQSKVGRESLSDRHTSLIVSS